MRADTDRRGARRLDSLHVLVVDDVEANALSMSQVLEVVGARVSTACTAADAIRLATGERFDIFICDIVMPDMDGYRMLAELRATALNTRTPAIAHTGHSGDDIDEAANAAGYDRVLSKPVGLDDLATAIRALCALTSRSPPAA